MSLKVWFMQIQVVLLPVNMWAKTNMLPKYNDRTGREKIILFLEGEIQNNECSYKSQASTEYSKNEKKNSSRL